MLLTAFMIYSFFSRRLDANIYIGLRRRLSHFTMPRNSAWKIFHIILLPLFGRFYISFMRDYASLFVGCSYIVIPQQSSGLYVDSFHFRHNIYFTKSATIFLKCSLCLPMRRANIIHLPHSHDTIFTIALMIWGWRRL